MKKRYIIIGGILLLGLFIIIARQTLFQGSKDVENMEYKTERSPIEDRFPDLPYFTECYWKADTIGSTSFGPTNYWMRGFLCFDEETFQKILAEHEWSAENIVFPKGIDASITGKNNFSWHINKEFQSMILRQNFVGSIFIDTTNGILYFDVENN